MPALELVELYKLKMEVEGEPKVKNLTAALAAEKQGLVDLQAHIASFGTTTAKSDAEVAKFTKNINALTQALARSQATLATQAAAAGDGAKKFGQFATQAGYFVDDVQYGFKGIANNIPGLLQTLGMGGGLAGILSIVAIVANQLYERWDTLANLFGMGATKTEAAAMEELGKKTEKTVAEAEKLAKFKREQAAAEAMGGPNKADAEREKEVTEGVKELGRQKAIDALSVIHRERIINSDPEAEKAAKEVDRLDTLLADVESGKVKLPMGQPAFLKKKRDEENAKLEARLNAGGSKELAEAATDDGKLKGLIATMEKDIGAFGPKGPDLLAALKGATPEAKKAATDEDAEWEKFERGNEDWKFWDGLKDGRKRRTEAEQLDAEDAEWERFTDGNARFKEGKNKQISKAKEAGIGDMVTALLKESITGGGNAEGLAKDLREKVIGKFGVSAGSMIMDQAEKDALKGAQDEWIKGKRQTRSETHGAVEFAKAVQAGVGGSVDVKQLEQLKRMSTILEQQLAEARKPKGAAAAVVGR
jgi:hypothetical protein